jgi:poly(A) polymerase
VRFIGDAQARIREDALRILRFFRFSARFAALPLDTPGLQACVILARDMMSLSRERIRDEMLKLLAAQNPLPVLELMLQHGLFEVFLPEVTSLAALKQLLLVEQRHHLPDPLRRFAALLPANADIVSDIAARFKTSRQVRGRLVDAAAHLLIVDATAMRAAVYRHGNVGAVDKLLIGSEPAADIAGLLDLGQHWRAPKLPFSGKHLIAAGISAGPAVSQALQALEADWIARDFPLNQPSLDALFKAAAARWRSHL